MSVINDKFRQEVHKEASRIMDKLEEQERFLARNGKALSGDQIYHAFSGMSSFANEMAIHFYFKDKSTSDD